MLECNWETKLNIGSFLGMEKIAERECHLHNGFH